MGSEVQKKLTGNFASTSKVAQGPETSAGTQNLLTLLQTINAPSAKEMQAGIEKMAQSDMKTEGLRGSTWTRGLADRIDALRRETAHKAETQAHEQKMAEQKAAMDAQQAKADALANQARASENLEGTVPADSDSKPTVVQGTAATAVDGEDRKKRRGGRQLSSYLGF